MELIEKLNEKHAEIFNHFIDILRCQSNRALSLRKLSNLEVVYRDRFQGLLSSKIILHNSGIKTVPKTFNHATYITRSRRLLYYPSNDIDNIILSSAISGKVYRSRLIYIP